MNFFFLAMIAFAAAIASVPEPPPAPLLAWTEPGANRVTLTGIDPSGSFIDP